VKISGARAWKRARFYPFSARFARNSANLVKNSAKLPQRKYYAIIGLGSNMKDEKQVFKKLFRLIMGDKRIKILGSSSLLINKAFGYEAQKDFTNAVLVAQSLLHARGLLKILLYYEFKFRRKRSFKNAPRILDIDLLYFSAKCLNDGFCTLPHPHAHERLSVILPLGEILERKC
jgi:2-amino-4-hydroxy-6-hydroxymethyldihydropteridine diphosphokinase